MIKFFLFFGDPETLPWSIFVISGDTDAPMITIHCPRRLTKLRAKQNIVTVIALEVTAATVSTSLRCPRRRGCRKTVQSGTHSLQYRRKRHYIPCILFERDPAVSDAGARLRVQTSTWTR